MKPSNNAIPQLVYDEEQNANRVIVVNQITGAAGDQRPFAAYRKDGEFGKILMEVGNKITSVRVERD